MSEYESDQEDAASRSVQTVRRLRDENVSRQRERQAASATRARPRGVDPMMTLKSLPRRKRCKYCRYRFDYRMYTNRCPECGRYRDDYPQPNHGLQALLFAGGVIGLLAVIVVLIALVKAV